jgi:hypothetical protein
MTGHFEKGVWVNDPQKPSVLEYTISVDTSQVEALKKRLEEMRDLFAVPESLSTFWQRLRWLITGKVRQ